MKKLELLKSGLELLVSIGVGILAGNAVGLIKPQNLGVIKKIACGVGGLAISGMAADKVTDYVDEQWTEASGQIKKLFPKKTEAE